jgi:hypothetical protein
MHMTEKDRHRVATLARALDETMVRCYLSMTSVLDCEEGFVCVAVSCERIGARNAGTEMKNMYVAPQHLAMCKCDKEWECALGHICI